MRNLIFANFARLRRDKGFWLLVGILFFLGLANSAFGRSSAAEMAAMGLIRNTEYFYFSQTPYLGLFYAVFLGLFLGADYADGPLRNRLIAGYKRWEIYLADWLNGYAACLVLFLAWYAGSLPALWWIGPFESGAYGHLAYLLIGAGFTGGFCALFVFVCSLTDHRALMVVFPLTVWVCVVLLGSGLYDRLNEPELLGGMAYIDGTFRQIAESPNPLYLSGVNRQICQGLLLFLPSGQSLLMGEVDLKFAAPMLALSGVFIALLLAVGLTFFQKRNFK